MNTYRKWTRWSRAAALALAANCWAAVGVCAGSVLEVGPGHTYATIQAAVDVAQPGDAIKVYPDTYVETVSVEKNHISILAEGEGVAVASPEAGQGCFEVKADGVLIRGFDLTGADFCPGIHFEGSYNRFSGNRIHDLNGPGVNALVCRAPKGGSNFNVIDDNEITNADLGIVVGSDSPNAVNKGNAIVGNNVYGLGAVGIAVYNSTETTVEGNVVEGISFGLGISIGTGPGKVAQHSHVVVGNRVRDTADSAIALFADDTCSLTKVFIGYNEVASTGVAGIYLTKDPGAHFSDSVIAANDVREADAVGILLDKGVNKITVEGNLTFDDGIYGISVAGNHNRISSNTALGNSTYDLVDAGKGNRWQNNVCETSSWGR